jgi:Protein of unknown function (DUF2948)
MDPLKLVALDKDDLEVISAHLQDAVINVGDIVWLRAEKRVVLGLNRFDWEAASCENPHYRRRRTALRFERVNAVKCRNIRPADKDAVLSLLTVEFLESDPPAGAVVLTFSGGAALRLEVECLETEISDLGPAWTTARCPDHAVEAADSRR